MTRVGWVLLIVFPISTLFFSACGGEENPFFNWSKDPSGKEIRNTPWGALPAYDKDAVRQFFVDHAVSQVEDLHFLDLPFYRTGTIAKKPVSTEDVRIIRELLEKIDPHQVYVAGDLSDPHGTHRVCAQAIFRAIQEHAAAHGSRPEVLLYRGAWQEYALHEKQHQGQSIDG